jgi:carbon storage regulator CsrA
MLVLTRKQQERIHIGDQIVITVVRIQGNTVRVGIEAPQDHRVLRGEVQRREAVAVGQDESHDGNSSEPPPQRVARRQGVALHGDSDKSRLELKTLAAHAV